MRLAIRLRSNIRTCCNEVSGNNYFRFSESCFSFYIPHLDLLQACRQEWDKRESMEQAALNRMRQERADYEAKLAAENDPNQVKGAADKGKVAGGKGKKGEKKEKKPKMEKKEKNGKKGKEKKMVEPPVVTEKTTVDLNSEFVAAEEMKHEKRMMKMHPDVGLMLTPTEVS